MPMLEQTPGVNARCRSMRNPRRIGGWRNLPDMDLVANKRPQVANKNCQVADKLLGGRQKLLGGKQKQPGGK